MTAAAHKFLDKEVPYTSTSAWRDWQEECNRLGPNAPPVFLQALRTGPEHTHYPAVLGLRLFGYQAWGYGDGAKRIYKVTTPGSSEAEVIKPVSPASDYNDPNVWQQLGEGT
jgi:hypothetical protein